MFFNAKDAIAILIFFSIALLIAYLNIYGVEYLGMKVPVNDQAFYSTTASGLIDTHMESTIAYLAPYYKYKTLNVPYHYFEYWLTYAVVNLTQFNTHLILNGIVYGFCIFCTFLAFYVILRNWFKKDTLIIIICSVVFISIRGILHYTNQTNENFVQATDSIFFDCNQKLVFILPMFLLGLYFDLKNNVQFGLLLLLLLPAMNIVLLPSILGGIIVFLSYQLLSNIRAYKVFFQSYLLIILAILFFVILVVFYQKFIALNLGNAAIVTSIGGVLNCILSNGLKWVLINAIILILIGVLLLKNANKEAWSIFVLCIGMVGSGIIGYALFDTNQNAWQIYSSGARFGGYALYLLIPFLLVTKSNWLQRSVKILGVLAILMFIENYNNIQYLPMKKISAYSPTYINAIGKFKFKNKIGIKYVNITNRPNLQRNPVYAGVCNYLVLTQNATSTVVLNVEDLLIGNKEDTVYNLEKLSKDILNMEIINLSPFFNDCQLKRQNITKMELLAIQKQFILRRKPEFCVVERGVNIPLYLKIKSKLIDKVTGEQFLLLNY